MEDVFRADSVFDGRPASSSKKREEIFIPQINSAPIPSASQLYIFSHRMEIGEARGKRDKMESNRA